MSEFIQWLTSISKKDNKVRAVLRRSLSFPPGKYPSAYPYVEPFIKESEYGWNRDMHYLIGGLWARHNLSDSSVKPMSFAKACHAYYLKQDQSPSLERRFIALLDADEDQFPNRLRQLISILKEIPIDFESLLKDTKCWTHPDKFIQNRWARIFYNTPDILKLEKKQSQN